MIMTQSSGKRRASFPWKDGRAPHVPCGPGDVAASVLLPGDPERVGIAAALLEEVRDFGRRREFRAATGRFERTSVTLCSTGIGGPSAEIALVELAYLGARRAIRIGGMGAITEELPLGSLLIVAEACGGTGAARAYGADGAFVQADGKVVAALSEAARRLGIPYKVGRVYTTDSYYLGQGRAFRAEDSDARTSEAALLARLKALGVHGMDMESETILSVGRHLGIKTGAILAVHGNRVLDTWLEDYEPAQRDVVRAAAAAMALLDGEDTGI